MVRSIRIALGYPIPASASNAVLATGARYAKIPQTVVAASNGTGGSDELA
jgi:hypothetical protein